MESGLAGHKRVEREVALWTFWDSHSRTFWHALREHTVSDRLFLQEGGKRIRTVPVSFYRYTFPAPPGVFLPVHCLPVSFYRYTVSNPRARRAFSKIALKT
jgi:hypothetical protein